jgi:tRNA modification GTPase
MAETIFAVSSGAPPAAIAVLRVSGPQAGQAIQALCGALPEPRRASLRALRDKSGSLLDHALVLWFPGQRTATGEDLAEFHLHGGRAVIAGVETALSAMEGLRRAVPGEFTRRAFANGVIDLAQAEGLADLLSAETELERRIALDRAGGAFSRQCEEWRDQVLRLSAQLESALDFSDEDDVSVLPPSFATALAALESELAHWLEAPRLEALKDGFRLALAGPPNAGKSTLFNALLRDEAAITSDIAGTTRDVLERAISLDGVPFTLVDMAGLRDDAPDDVERIGISRAAAEMEKADLVLWLGPPDLAPVGAWRVATKADLDPAVNGEADWRVSGKTGQGLDALVPAIVAQARAQLPKPGRAALNDRQRALIGDAHAALLGCLREDDELLMAENLRLARTAFDRLIGRASTEDMLDTLFGCFCIGK